MTAQPQEQPIPETSALDLTRRDERALAMRIAGYTLAEIAGQFGWTQDAAQEALERALVRSLLRDPASVNFQRALAGERLDALLAGMWDRATDAAGHPIVQQNAVRTVLGIMDRQANLYGTNAPREVTVTHTVSPDQVAATIERLFAARSGVVEAEVVGAPAAEIEDVVEAEIVEDD